MSLLFSGCTLIESVKCVIGLCVWGDLDGKMFPSYDKVCGTKNRTLRIGSSHLE